MKIRILEGNLFISETDKEGFIIYCDKEITFESYIDMEYFSSLVYNNDEINKVVAWISKEDENKEIY